MQNDDQNLLDQDILSSYSYFGKVLGIISLSMFINRFVFYGFRSFFLYYLTTENGLGLPSQEALDYYSLYSTGVYIAFIVMGILVLGIKRSALSALIGQQLAILGYAGFLLAPEIPVPVLIGLIIAGEGLFRIGIFVAAVHNFLAGGKAGIITVTLLYLVINAAAFFASLLFPFIWDNSGTTLTLTPIIILGVINLLLLRSLLPYLQEAFILMPKTMPDLNFPVKIGATAGLIIVTSLFWFIYESLDVYFINEKLNNVSHVKLFGVNLAKNWINSLPGLIPMFFCALLLLLYLYNSAKSLTYHLSTGLITAGLGFMMVLGFNQFYDPAKQDFTMYFLSQFFVGISEIFLMIAVLVTIAKWYKPWLMAAVYGLYMGVVGLVTKARGLLFGEELNDLNTFLIFILFLCVLMLIGGIGIFFKKNELRKISQG